MRTTRQSTGSLPPRRKNIAEYSCEDEDSEEELEVAPKTRARKERSTTSNRSEKRARGKGERRESSEEPMPSDDCENTKAKTTRMGSLITGPGSRFVPVRPVGSNTKACTRRSDPGGLARMIALPVDVLCEIATYLLPLDLLRLSRTNHVLRDCLLSKSSRAVWVSSMKAIRLPPCPSDMSEPQYANLYFDKDCHGCGYSRVEKRMDLLRIRLCNGCSKVNIIQGKDLVKENFDPEVGKMSEIYSLLPWRSMNSSDAESCGRNSTKSQNRYFLRYDFVEVVKAYLKTEPDSEERRAFVARRHQLIQEIVQSSKDVFEWEFERVRNRKSMEQELCKRRRAQIKERLLSLGYLSDEINAMGPSDDWTRIVYRPRELTDRIWNTIRPRLEELLSMRRERIKRGNRLDRHTELFTLFKKYADENDLEEADVGPFCFVDLIRSNIVSDLVEEEDCTIQMTEARWQMIEEKFPEILDDQARTFKRHCATCLVTGQLFSDAPVDAGANQSGMTTAEEAVDTSILYRANALFRMGTAPYSSATFSDIVASRSRFLMRDIEFWTSWSSGWISPDETAIQVANAVLSSLGLSKKTTMKHMKRLGVAFVCQQCDRALRVRMTWCDLIRHISKEITDYKEGQAHAMSKNARLVESHRVHTDGAPLAVVNPKFAVTTPYGVPYECPLCRNIGMYKQLIGRERLSAHLRTCHYDPDSEVESP